LDIQCDGKIIKVDVKIIDDWEEKREFIYLKEFKIKERFLVKTIKKNNFKNCKYNYDIDGFINFAKIDLKRNSFNVEIIDRSEYIPSEQLKIKVMIEIAISKIMKNFLPLFEKRVLFD